tara:strand:- start:98 stop:430 length:333 start_codon:yes stop_codon:yes gene_type:complete
VDESNTERNESKFFPFTVMMEYLSMRTEEGSIECTEGRQLSLQLLRISFDDALDTCDNDTYVWLASLLSQWWLTKTEDNTLADADEAAEQEKTCNSCIILRKSQLHDFAI